MLNFSGIAALFISTDVRAKAPEKGRAESAVPSCHQMLRTEFLLLSGYASAFAFAFAVAP